MQQQMLRIHNIHTHEPMSAARASLRHRLSSSCHRSKGSTLFVQGRQNIPVFLRASRAFARRSLYMGSEVPQQQQQQQQAVHVPAASASAEEQSTWSEYNQRWFELWNDGLQKGQHFDKGAASPQLMQLLSSGQLQVQGKRALVPGCGRGYDVVAFAAAGAAVSVGLDICPEAIAAANAQRDQQLAGHPDAAKVAAATEMSVGDFFTYSHSSGQLFDVGYDYTFLCALHPDMRTSWAEGWARLLSPGGELVTMVYPVDASRDPNHGPPWPLTPELYQQLLVPAGFELVSLEPIPANLSHDSRQGKEWLGRWRRQS